MTFSFGCACGACAKQQAEFERVGARIASGLAQVAWFIVGNGRA